MNAADYDYRINQARAAISACKAEITDLQAKVENLNGFGGAVEEYAQQLRDAAGKMTSVFDDQGGLVGAIASAAASISSRFFHTVTDVLNGAEYAQALRTAQRAAEAAAGKRSELQNRISQLQTQISSCNAQIAQLSQQKQAFLQQEARRAAEIAKAAAAAAKQ